jgi:NhaP-type Na+/H+ or K+/H+ antiporter
LFSYIIKERLFFSEALVAVSIGIAVGPIGLNWISIDRWTEGDTERANLIVFEVTRIILGIQVLATGIALPKAYLKKRWRELTVLLLVVMTVAWFISALIIWGIAPGLTFLEALVIAACVTPTDPVLSASIVKGRFAEEHVDKRVRDLIAA